MKEAIFLQKQGISITAGLQERVHALGSDNLRLISSPSLLSTWTNSNITSGDDNTYLLGMLWGLYGSRYEISLENSLVGHDGLCLLILTLWTQRQEGQEFKVVPSYVDFSRHKTKRKRNQKGNHLEYVCLLCVYHQHPQLHHPQSSGWVWHTILKFFMTGIYKNTYWLVLHAP